MPVLSTIIDSMKENRYRDILVLVSAFMVIAGVAGLVVWQWPLVRELFSNPDNFRAYVDSFGVLAPLVYVGVYTVMVIVAVAPASFLNFLGGAMFGVWEGFLYSWVANILGAAVALYLLRYVVRSLVRVFVSPKSLERFHNYIRKRGWAYLFILYAVPVPPGDILNFVSAASNIRLYKLLLMIGVARIFPILLRSAVGTTLVRWNTLSWIIMFGLFFAVLGVLYLLRSRIDRLAERFSEKFFPKHPEQKWHK